MTSISICSLVLFALCLANLFALSSSSSSGGSSSWSTDGLKFSLASHSTIASVSSSHYFDCQLALASEEGQGCEGEPLIDDAKNRRTGGFSLVLIRTDGGSARSEASGGSKDAISGRAGSTSVDARDGGSSHYLRSGFIPMLCGEDETIATTGMVTNPSQAYLLTANGPLCVFTGFSGDVRLAAERLRTWHVKHSTSRGVSSSSGAAPLPDVLDTEFRKISPSPFVHPSLSPTCWSTASQLTSIMRAESLKLHCLAVSYKDPAGDENGGSSNFENALIDVQYDGSFRDWTKGGASAIGKRGASVRASLSRLLFEDPPPTRIYRELKKTDRRDRMEEFCVKVVLSAIAEAFPKEEGGDDSLEDCLGNLQVLVLDKNGCRKMDSEDVAFIVKDFSERSASGSASSGAS